MKNRVVLLFVLVAASSAIGAPALTEAWSARYLTGAHGDLRHAAMTLDAAGNIYVTGLAQSSNGWTYATVKYDRTGRQLWDVRDVPGLAYAIATDRVGNVYVAGEAGAGYGIVKYDSLGRQVWLATVDDGFAEQPTAIALDRGGNVYVTGSVETNEVSYFPRDYLTAKIDPNGSVLWARHYDGGFRATAGFNGGDWARALAIDDAGNAYVTGASQGPRYDDYATVKYDPDGNELWVDRLSSGSASVPFALAIDREGNAYVTGYSSVYDEQTDEQFVAAAVTLKYDSAGRRVWIASSPGPKQPSAMGVDAAGSVFITGSSEGCPPFGCWSDYFTIKYTPDGTEAWERTFDGSASRIDQARALAVDARGHVYVTGWSQTETILRRFGETRYMSDFVTLEYDPAGNLEWLGRHNCPTNADDVAVSVKLDLLGNVIVAGTSWQDWFIPWSFATVKYQASPCRSILLLQARLKSAEVANKVPGSLNARLKAACGAFERDDARLGKLFLGMFQDQVRAHLEGTDPQLAEELIDIAGQIIASAI